MTIKLIACDLDGTTMGEDLVFSPRLLQAVWHAQERGTMVVIATGRGYSSALFFARQLGAVAPLICYQGALIKTQEGETIYRITLSSEHLPQVVSFCEEGRWELTMYCDDQIYYTARVHDQAYYNRWFNLPSHLVDNLLAALPSDPIKFIAIAPTKTLGDQLQTQLSQFARGRFQITRSHDWFVEGIPLDASKGRAVARLAERLGIRREEVMALGDHGNDRSMVEWAGLGVAVGNASPDVKAVADAIVPPQSEDGAAWAIERYVLGGRQ